MLSTVIRKHPLINIKRNLALCRDALKGMSCTELGDKYDVSDARAQQLVIDMIKRIKKFYKKDITEDFDPEVDYFFLHVIWFTENSINDMRCYQKEWDRAFREYEEAWFDDK